MQLLQLVNTGEKHIG